VHLASNMPSGSNNFNEFHENHKYWLGKKYSLPYQSNALFAHSVPAALIMCNWQGNSGHLKI